MNAACSPIEDYSHVKLRLAALVAIVLLSACRHAGDLTDENGGGVYAVRSDCPIAGIPTGTGDITLFNPEDSRFASAIDVTAAMSQLRATCQDVGDEVVSTVTFTVTGLRRDNGAPRRVVLPYFDVALRGGTQIAAKQIGAVALDFPAGREHAITRAQATIRVNRGAATLPTNVRAILTRPRKAGQADAAIDPMSDPAVERAVANSTFEHLVGFEMTPDQLKYNATR